MGIKKTTIPLTIDSHLGQGGGGNIYMRARAHTHTHTHTQILVEKEWKSQVIILK